VVSGQCDGPLLPGTSAVAGVVRAYKRVPGPTGLKARVCPLGRRGLEAESGLAEERVDEVGSALDGAEPAADQGLELVETGRGQDAELTEDAGGTEDSPVSAVGESPAKSLANAASSAIQNARRLTGLPDGDRAKSWIPELYARSRHRGASSLQQATAVRRRVMTLDELPPEWND
jgi:hypothetical protein